MATYTFAPMVAVNPDVVGSVIINGSGSVYAPEDVNFQTPLTMRRLDGTTTTTITTNARGLTQAFTMEDYTSVIFKDNGPGGTAPLDAARGVIEEVLARTAEAEQHAADAAASAQDIATVQDAGMADILADPNSQSFGAVGKEKFGPQELANHLTDFFPRVTASFEPDKMYANVGVVQNVPGHIDPAGGETTHPSVVYAPDGWNGYKYWMAHTPYPGSQAVNEDPNIVASNDGDSWETPPGLVNPLDNLDADPDYNSDTHLAWGPDNELYLFWRSLYGSTPGQEERIYMRRSVDGINWDPKVLVHQSALSTLRILSPSISYFEGTWYMWGVDMVPEPNRVVRLTAPNAAGPWSAPVGCTVSPVQAGKEVWHIFVMRHGRQWVGILNDTNSGQSGHDGDLMFIASDDGLTWTATPRSVVDRIVPGKYTDLYRATLVPAIRNGLYGFDMWYSAADRSGTPVWNVYRTHLAETGDTPWQSLELLPGFTAGVWGALYRKVGRSVRFKGQVIGTFGANLYVQFAAGLGPGWDPEGPMRGHLVNSSNTWAMGLAEAGQNLKARSTTAATYITLDGFGYELG